MPIVPIEINQKSAPARYKQGGDARLVNCYVEQIGKEGKAPWAIYSSDGLQGWCVLPNADGGIRASLYVDGTLYVVAGTRFYSVNPTTQAATLIGAMNVSKTVPVYMERNRRSPADIMIVTDGIGFYYRSTASAWAASTAYILKSCVLNNGNLYVCTQAGTSGATGPSGTTTNITDGTVKWNYLSRFGTISSVDSDIFTPQSLAFNNGYFIVGTSDNRYQAGSLDDVLNWDPLSYGRADANPDPIVRVAQYQGDLVIFGEKSTQFARDVGSTPFPYQNVSSNDVGLFGANSVASIEQTLIFVANDRSVRLLSGYEAQKISSHSVDRDIQNITDPNQIIATSWVNGGHSFYSVSSPYWTWVYDTVTNCWHERKTHNTVTWDIANVVRVDSKLIAGSRTNGILYEMDADFQDEAGEELISSIVFPPVHLFPYPFTFNSVFFDVEVGAGIGAGNTQDVDPAIMFEWSEDGGENYKGWRSLKIGKQGQNLTRVRIWRLGQSKEDGYTFRLSWSAKVARALYNMAADVEKDAA